MPTVRPTCVVSFSSEDSNHPASNLLKGETFRKWKCKEEGEKTAYVILQLGKAVSITGLDIGNEHSAFVEVQVGRSGQVPQKFEILLSQSSFMTPQDSRNSTNTNRVRMFGLDKFDKTVAAQKWDLVKVVCVQEFNTHVQFGISFINITAAPDPNEKPKIAGFSIRPAVDEEEKEPEPVRIGSLFAKRMKDKEQASPNNGSPAVAIRSASSSLAGVAISSTEERVKELKKQKIVLSDEDEPIIIGSSSHGSTTPTSSGAPRNKSWYGTPPKKADSASSSNSTNHTTPSSSKMKTGLEPKKTAGLNHSVKKDGGNNEKVESSSGSSQRTLKSPKPVKKRKKRVTKPFSKLLEDVVFVMSGFQNPYRSELRRKACEMGARCKHDWDDSCTHLICAFVKTPKFQEVRRSGHGKIVKKDWIEACYDDRWRYPWRRYCLDWNDKGDESEEEIQAELSGDEEGIEMGREEGSSSAEEDGDANKNLDRTSGRGVSGGGSGGKTGTPRREGGPGDGEDNEVIRTPKKKRKRIIELDDDDDDDDNGGGKDGKHAVAHNEKKESSDDEVEEVGRSTRAVVVDPDSTPRSGQKPDDTRHDHRCSNDDDDDDPLSESYLVDTDVEEDSHGREGSSSPSLLANYDKGNVSDFFDGTVFFLHVAGEGRSAEEKKNVERIIRLHKGEIEKGHTNRVDYVLTDAHGWLEDFSEALAENPNLTFVHWEWIVECEKRNEMISAEPFMILPN